MSGESADVDLDVVEDFKSRIGEILADYDPKDVFNCDETSLFYRALPDKTPALKGDKVKGGKQSKECLTILLACSSTGEKLQPLVIGKSQKLKAFCRHRCESASSAVEIQRKSMDDWPNFQGMAEESRSQNEAS